MRKFLVIFTILFLFIIASPTLNSANTGKSEVNPKEFSKWTIESIMTGGIRGEAYVWLKNPNEGIKINRAILKTVKGFIIEYMYWNENDTSFRIIRRFKYNLKKDRYDEMAGDIKKW